MDFNRNDLKSIIAGELITSGIYAPMARNMAYNIVDKLEDKKSPLSAEYGWISSKQDGYWHWSSTRPEDGLQTRPATSWEKFFFNSFGNTSKGIMEMLVPIL